MEAFIRVIIEDIGIIPFLGACGFIVLLILGFKSGNKKDNNGGTHH